MKNEPIKYPYLPEGRSILYVGAENAFMQAARDVALSESLDDALKTGVVVVKDGTIIAKAANGSEYHKMHICERVRLNVPTGQGYELCEGCHPKNHAEGKAMTMVTDADGGDVYLWGHWWCCEPCWNSMITASIAHVYLLEGSERLFNKNSEEHILGRW